ncbi:MAG: hypothetical protein H0W08_20640 [Acidobacteria bacterium]|nr:hypothetical protein [Acidobacteriota bacterium]
MKPTDIRRLKKAAWRIHDKADVTDDPILLEKALRHLVALDAIEAASLPPDNPTAITRIKRVIVSPADGWEQLLTDDERAQLSALRAAAAARREQQAPAPPAGLRGEP